LLIRANRHTKEEVENSLLAENTLYWFYHKIVTTYDIVQLIKL